MGKIPLKVKTDQEAFDAVVRHLAALPERAANPLGDCKYATGDGRRCAVGALLDGTDEELYRIYGSVGGGADYFIDYGEVTPWLLGDLQTVHDPSGNWQPGGFTAWAQLEVVAKRYHLDPAVLEAYA